MIVDHTKIGAALRRLSLPLAVQMLGDQLLGVVDTIAIGYISTRALAGVTAATTVFFTLIMMLTGLWSGLGIIAAQRIGAHDVDGFARTVRAGFRCSRHRRDRAHVGELRRAPSRCSMLCSASSHRCTRARRT